MSRDSSYKKTIKRIQSELDTHSRLFSKIIHISIVERSGDFIAATIARPNSILLGSLFAFVGTVIFFTTAKRIGYLLSGSETMILFAIGWTAGIIVDYFKTLIIGKK